MRKVEDIVKDHLLYLDAVHEFTDWLHSAKEELHRWSDASGDTSTIQKKLAKINVRLVSFHDFDSDPMLQNRPDPKSCGILLFVSLKW